MGLKCCVGGCESTSNTHRVFCFPKNDSLRNLWMSFLVPTNPLLIGLSKEQLLRKRVCEKHFDKHQFDEDGKRIRYSYPCLFTNDEIAHGEPLSTAGTVRDVLSDHNYFKERDDEDDLTGAVLVVGKAGENFHEHPSCSHSQAVTSVTEKEDGILDQQPSCSYKETIQEKVVEQLAPSELEHNVNNSKPIVKVTLHDKNKEGLTKKCQGYVMKKLASKKRKFIKFVTNTATASLGHTSSERLSQAMALGSTQLLENFKHLNKQAQVFLLMQLKQCRKNKMARRFTFDEKLMALVLMKQSPKAYKLLQHMFALPNKRTLHRLSEKISIEPGLTPQVFSYIEKKTMNWDVKNKLCSIVFDEVALTPHLTYNEKTDQIYGFVDVAGERKMKLCDHALVFMVRGICSSWRQSIAYYLCEGTTSAAALQNILKQVVSQVAQTGLIPLGLVCDQGSTFRTAIKNFREDTIRMRNAQNINDDGSINIVGHDLSIFYDPPHLLKGLRNNFLTKNIIWEGKTASWKDIQFIYDLDSKLGHTRALPKLTAHHVNPDKIKKMKVSVAAQVFSARTAAMLKYTNALQNFQTRSGDTTATGSMETTAEVVEFIDKLFDSINSYPGGATRGKLRKAIKVNSPHHSFWTDAIQKLKMLKFEDSGSKLAIQTGKPRLVRVPSLEGWITTLESFIRISKLLFENYSVEYYYPRNINQDPLEKFFGRIRALNYRNVNPDPITFIYSFKSLVLSNFLNPHSKFSNCEVDNGETLLDADFLFEELNENKENEPPNTSSLPSTSQGHPGGTISKDEVIIEKIKVQCSAYTAGYICRKMSKSIKCQNCLKTYISNSDENIHDYIKYRDYKSLKNNNLAYPNARFLILYRDASNLIHNFLNQSCHKKNICSQLKSDLTDRLRFSWLGCANHCTLLKNIFLNHIMRLHVHNWCNIMNKILKGDIEEKYVSRMEEPQKMALNKYKTYRLRKKTLNK